MKTLAVIPARGGSKRVPRKNIRLFCGKPMISYSIDAALQSSLFDEVVVSTDDQEIASVSKQFGASVLYPRPERNFRRYNWCYGGRCTCARTIYKTRTTS